ncbi:hypothetical protein FQA39_LY17845 [Lamprigera yunnana]|nr:hypothetical protein FQA39_LY17845 [Lamprigera yunnana]
MAFPQPNSQREIANRKILEDLYMKKQLLLKQGVASSLSPPIATVLSNNLPNSDGHTNALSSMQRAALQQANAQSMGYFISQDSSFGNFVLPLRHLQELLQQIDDFHKPKVSLEQYVTPSHLASHMLYTIQTQYGDITDKVVADLGSGSGSLTIGAAVLNAGIVIGFEIDQDALETCSKNIIEQEFYNIDIVQCDVTKELTNSKCGLLYHPSCAKRAKINADGWVSFCCYSTAADEVNEVNDLDENSRVLFKLIEAKFNGLEVKFNGLDSKIDNTLITVKEKLCELDDRVLKLEDNNVYLLENVISEINKRNSKECNCIIYKLEDSENAVKKDIELFKNLLACCNDEPSFNINDIKLIRLGKKFKSGVDRPLKVVFPNKDCLHWFFHNKKMIIEKSKKSIIITGDLTNAQRDFRNKVLSEIKLLIMNPPFGTKHNTGIDMDFLKKAITLSRNSVYSLHKTSTRSHVLKVAMANGAKGEVLAKLRYNLPSTYKFHKKNSVDIEVDFFRFEKIS